MKELELQEEFTLEDIIKEFGGTPLKESDEPETQPAQSDPEEAPAEPVEESSEEMPEAAETVSPELPEEPETPAEPETGEEPAKQEEAGAAFSDTIRLDRSEVLKGIAHNAVTISDEEEDTVVEIPEEKPAFTEEWEPEYEQPIGEYVPPQPIIFPSRPVEKEVKHKLIVGPEKKYYELAEKGLGKLQFVLFISLIVVILSALSTVLYAQGMVPENRLRLMIFGQFMAVLFSALLGSFQMIQGVADLAKGKFTLNTLLMLTFFACCADGVFCLIQERIPCCAAFSLTVMMSLWRTYNRRHSQMGQMDTLRKASRLQGITTTPEGIENRTAVVHIPGMVEHFMDNYDQESKPEKRQNVFALIALIFSIGAGVFAGVTHDLQTGVQITAVCLLAAVPATAFVAVSRPFSILQRRLHRLGTVLCGWQGVEQLKGKVSFPIRYGDLFPVGSTRMNGVKFFGTRPTEQVLAYATAIMVAEGGGLAPLFTQVLDSRNGEHYEAYSVHRYDGSNGGFGGIVNDEPVLAGPLEFLKVMGVDIPEGIQVSQAVCVAIDGELCGVFAISYEKTRSATAGLSTLTNYRRLNPTVVANEFMLSESFIRSKFGIKSKRMKFPLADARLQLQMLQPAEDAQAAVITTMNGLAPMAYGVSGARALRTACNLGVLLHIIGGVLGMGIVLTLLILGALHLLTPVNMFLYQLVWLIPGMLITEWTRSI